jgi:hypothetical protein
MSVNETVDSPQAAERSRWSAGRIASLTIGVLLVLIALALVGAGGTGIWADLTQRDGGYVTTGAHRFSASGSALATEHTQLGTAGSGWLYAPGLLGKVRIHVTPTGTGRPLFVGIGRSSDVDRYLTGVDHTVISDFFGDKVESVDGAHRITAPGRQRFWAATSSGSGERTLLWHPSDGSWTVVVMNADGQPGIDVSADLGARFPAARWISIGLLLGGAVFVFGGGLLVAGAIRPERRSHAND